MDRRILLVSCHSAPYGWTTEYSDLQLGILHSSLALHLCIVGALQVSDKSPIKLVVKGFVKGVVVIPGVSRAG